MNTAGHVLAIVRLGLGPMVDHRGLGFNRALAVASGRNYDAALHSNEVDMRLREYRYASRKLD